MIEVKAPLTGTIWKIECKEGDSVEEGDVLIIMESMKMEIPVEAEDDSKIIKILVKEGDSVNEDDILLTLEEE